MFAAELADSGVGVLGRAGFAGLAGALARGAVGVAELADELTFDGFDDGFALVLGHERECREPTPTQFHAFGFEQLSQQTKMIVR